MLETDRCKLYKMQESDYEDIKKLYVDEKVRRFLGGTIDDEEIYRTKFIKMCKQENNSWVIKLKEDSRFIGLVSLELHHDDINTEISYQFLPEWWGHGYATEAIIQVISYAFKELRLTKIVAETQTANESSCRLLKRIGMNLEQTVERFGSNQSIFSIYKNSEKYQD